MTVSWRLLLPFRRQSPRNYITVKLRIWKSFEEWFIVLCSQLDRRVRVWRPLKVIPVLAWLTEKWAKRAINEIIERCTTKEDIQMANEHMKRCSCVNETRRLQTALGSPAGGRRGSGSSAVLPSRWLCAAGALSRWPRASHPSLRLRALGFSILPRLPPLPHRSACTGTAWAHSSHERHALAPGPAGACQGHARTFEGQSPTPGGTRGRDTLQDCNLRHCLMSQACQRLPSPRSLGVFSRNAATSVSYK